MKKTVIMVVAAASFLSVGATLTATPAEAQRGVDSKYCDPGTCAMNGARYARFGFNCKAQYCPDFKAKAQQVTSPAKKPAKKKPAE